MSKLFDTLQSIRTLDDKVIEYGQERHQEGKEEGIELAEADFEEKLDKSNLEFAIEKFKEMEVRGISNEQMISELESELCRHMPVNGPTLFDK